MAKRESDAPNEIGAVHAIGDKTARVPADAPPSARHSPSTAPHHAPAVPPAAVPAGRGRAPQEDVDTEAASTRKKGSLLGRLALIALLGIAAVYGGRFAYEWWTDGRFLVSTDDAYIAADITTLAAKASGYVTYVVVADNQPVKAGDIIARIDDGDYRLALTQAENTVAGNRATIARIDRQIEAATAQVEQARAGVASAEATLTSAEATFDRQTALVASHVSAQSQLDDARAGRDAARAAVTSSRAAVDVAEANVDVLKAQKVEAEATGKTLATAVDKARRDLSFTEVRAPVDGIVGNSAFKVGTYVTPGQRLAAIVATNSAHIEANYKETQLADLKPGEKVRITVDALAGKEIEGTVESLSPATGSVFSLLPANNATGNFTKVVQRLPVRVSLPVGALASGEFRPGLSVVVAADTRTIPKE